jgi:acyl-CoA reductase-like NAD-dependent aldehyde dehydrogenase
MRLKAAYGKVLSRIGDPLDKEILIGPLHSAAAVKSYQDTLSEAVKAGGTIEFGGNVSCFFLAFVFFVHISHSECIVVRSCLLTCLISEL